MVQRLDGDTGRVRPQLGTKDAPEEVRGAPSTDKRGCRNTPATADTDEGTRNRL